MDRSFKVFNVDKTKNGEVTRFTLLEVKINEHKKQIDTMVMNLNSMDMFLGYDWLVKLLLLSFLLLSYIVVLKRILANIFFPFDLSTSSNF